MHKNASSGDAALAAGFEGADKAACDRQIKTSVFANDDGALTAHLTGDDAIIHGCRHFLNAPTHIVAAGEKNAVDAWIFHQRLAHFGVAVKQVDDTRWKASFLE